MGIPSSQITASWVKEELDSDIWVSLRDIAFRAVKKKWVGRTDSEVWEHVETNLQHIAEHLRNNVSEWVLDGSAARFEIDNEPSPYIRQCATLPSEVALKLRRINPFELEDICARLLHALGATSHFTQKTNDGGIDFVGVSLKIIPGALPIPAACGAAVIGQAKRYKDGNVIRETDLREFVGAATLKKHELNMEGKVGPLAPVLFAFWTTSDFDPNAKRYARALGIWYMDGVTLAEYVTALNLRDFVLQLPDHLPARASLAAQSDLANSE